MAIPKKATIYKATSLYKRDSWLTGVAKAFLYSLKSIQNTSTDRKNLISNSTFINCCYVLKQFYDLKSNTILLSMLTFSVVHAQKITVMVHFDQDKRRSDKLGCIN